MSKTPYELRYELLMMAQSILSENLMNERIRLENDWNAKRDLVVEAAGRGVTGPMPSFPSVPKLEPEKIIALAKQLNEFVSNNGE